MISMKETGPRKFISYIRCTCQEEVDEHRYIHAKWMAEKYAKKSLDKMASAKPYLEERPGNVKPDLVQGKNLGGFGVW